MGMFLCVTPFIQGDGVQDAAIAHLIPSAACGKAASATLTPSTHAPEALLPRRWVQGGDSGEAGAQGWWPVGARHASVRRQLFLGQGRAVHNWRCSCDSGLDAEGPGVGP